MNIFFSHSSNDEQIVQQLVEILSEGKQDIAYFYSSDPKTGVPPGEGIISRINREIDQCQLFVSVITENYVRSQYCMYELSVAAFLQERKQLRIIPIVTNTAIYDRIRPILPKFDMSYIEAGAPKAVQNFSQSFSWVKQNQYPQVEDMLGQLAQQTHSVRTYIGMSQETYTGILEYCQKYGIKQFKDTTLPSDIIKRKVSQANAGCP